MHNGRPNNYESYPDTDLSNQWTLTVEMMNEVDERVAIVGGNVVSNRPK